MSILLYRSNRAEALVEQLAALIARAPGASPGRAPQPECIAVQGPGMERWLSMQLAERLGVWAQPWFPFPRALIEGALDAALGPAEPDAAQVFCPEGLTWAVARQLPALIERPGFEQVRAYTDGDPRCDRAFALAAQLARCFDRYLVYRPEMILRWEDHPDEDQDFQAQLWRALMRSLPDAHIARRAGRLAAHLTRGGDLRAADPSFPERVHLFGVSALPPLFVRALDAMSAQLEVHLYALAPSQVFLGDLDDEAGCERPDVVGLLSACGRLSRDFQQTLEEACAYEEPSGELFVHPGEGSLLRGLQADLLSLTSRPADAPPRSLAPDDRSLQVHACHSPTRELEVLRDELRDRLERDPSLTPRDIAVLAVDIERYAPAIEAVFGADEGEPDHIPYRIADRGARATAEVIDALDAVLELVDGRLSASDVLDLLGRPPVRRRAGIDEAELPTLTRWVRDAGARWGADPAHRARLGQPALAENTWQQALDRLLLGYASPHGTERLYAGVFPHDDVEGQEAALLGRFATFCEALFSQLAQLSAPRPLSDWQRDLNAAMDALLAVEPETAPQHARLRDALAQLAERAGLTGMTGPVPLASLRRELQQALERQGGLWGFLSGGVTFCQYVPMRAIPFRVVCLLGMEDEHFPRNVPRAAFDRMAETPRRGDRLARDDDRQMFLEALLSARDALIITYVGSSVQDDSVRPASVLVEQLLALVEQSFVPSDARGHLRLGFEGGARQRCQRRHPLQRFSPRYFEPKSGWFSYDRDACAAAQALLQPLLSAPRFWTRPLPAAPRGENADAEEVTLEELVRYFRNPSRALLQRRLAVYLPGDLDELPDREVMALEGLHGWKVGEALLRACARGRPEEEVYERLRAQGVLPLGTLGRLAFEQHAARAAALLEAAEHGEPLDDLPLNLALPGARLRGRVTELFRAPTQRGVLRVECTFSSLAARHKLNAWIRHLALCSVSPEAESVLVGRQRDEAQVVRFAPVPDAREALTELVALYVLGQRVALPFFVDAAWAYLDALPKKGEQGAAQVARRAFTEPRGAAEDAYVRQLYSDQAPDDPFALPHDEAPGFATLAEAVLGRARAHLTRGGRT